ncbi:MAG: cupin domain-containing protein [Sphingobacteriales bacterium]|nr:cupin domain-containing protein [Sphingobacteriales bacterium]OJV98385.1 MAG: cupin [Sphingobacteriales bacterium 44-61]
MRLNKSNSLLLVVLVFLSVALLGCREKASKETAGSELYNIFPKGELGPAGNFTGKAWNMGLVPNDSTYTTLVGNVYFEPGARSNWHTHPAGQILIITDGVGFHQIKGQPKQLLHKGDVVQCPPGAEHWHGASPDTGLQQLYIVPNTEKGIVQWLQPVTDEEYKSK